MIDKLVIVAGVNQFGFQMTFNLDYGIRDDNDDIVYLNPTGMVSNKQGPPPRVRY